MKKKSLHHFCIQASNYNETKDFYIRILGFELVKETPDFHNRDFNTWLRLGETMIELQTSRKGELLSAYNELSEGIVHICFLVDNIHDEYSRLKQFDSIKFLQKNGQDIYKVENGYLFKIKAPEGTIIEIRDNKEI